MSTNKTEVDSCDLCGLAIRRHAIASDISGKAFRFCCAGCRQVFHMLLGASDSADPASFKSTELFKKCKEMGIVPASEADLEKRQEVKGPDEPVHVTDDNALTLNLRIDHMWCPACAWVIEEALKKSPGVLDAGCNFSTDRLRCEYDPIRTSPRHIIQTISHLGYRAAYPGEETASREKRREFLRLIISALLTMNVMMLSFSLYTGFFTAFDPKTVRLLSWPIFIMAGIVLLYGGRNIYRRAWAGLTSAAFSMETLITIGATSAFLYSTFSFFTGSIHLYFDSAAMLITLVLLGKTLEGKAKGEVQEVLANFFFLLPTKVKRCSDGFPGGRYVSVEHLQKGDAYRVEEGEVLPADGIVLEGSGAMDESSLTGEAVPLEKRPGDPVKSGSRVVQGRFKVKAVGVGKESTLGQMIQIMEKALGKKTRLEGTTDRLLRWFVPGILFLSAGTAAGCLLSGLSYDETLLRAITVLVIACPCSLGIAIPLARVAGVSLAGRNGLLVRDFSAFERADGIHTFVLDKTGTVTEGKWALREVIPYPSYTPDRVLALALTLEMTSDHPIAVEIKRRAEERRIGPVTMEGITSFENGRSGRIGKDEVIIGSSSFVEMTFEDAPPGDPEDSYVFMSFGGAPCAVLVFGDRIRKGTLATMNRLRSEGRRLVLISGDGETATRAIGGKIGIEETHGGKLPQEKASIIEALQEGGKTRVAMVGDGINDAPALIQADLGIAVYSGSHLGKEAANITLMRGNPAQLTDFLDLARRVKRKVHQNLIFSFSYNLVSIPIAMSGLLNPLIAVSAMLLSSLSVIGNTILLIRKDSRIQGSKGSSR